MKKLIFKLLVVSQFLVSTSSQAVEPFTVVAAAASVVAGVADSQSRAAQFKDIQERIELAKEEIINKIEVTNIDEFLSLADTFLTEFKNTPSFEAAAGQLIAFEGQRVFDRLTQIAGSTDYTIAGRRSVIDAINVIGAALSIVRLQESGWTIDQINRDIFGKIYASNQLFLEEVYPNYVRAFETTRSNSVFGKIYTVGNKGQLNTARPYSRTTFFKAISVMFSEYRDIESSQATLSEYLNLPMTARTHFVGNYHLDDGRIFKMNAAGEWCVYSSPSSFEALTGSSHGDWLNRRAITKLNPGYVSLSGMTYVGLCTISSVQPGDQPVVGDFDQDGVDDYGIYRNGRFHISTDGDSDAEFQFNFGVPGDTPVVGDFDRDGLDDYGVQQGNLFQVRTQGNQGVQFSDRLGNPGFIPVVGDFNRDGVDDYGVFNRGRFYIITNGDGRVNLEFSLGQAGDIPVVGDVNQDGVDDFGVFRNGTFFISTNGNSQANLTFKYGQTGDTPVIGDFDKDGIDDIGVYRNGTFYISVDGDSTADLNIEFQASI